MEKKYLEILKEQDPEITKEIVKSLISIYSKSVGVSFEEYSSYDRRQFINFLYKGFNRTILSKSGIHPTISRNMSAAIDLLFNWWEYRGSVDKVYEEVYRMNFSYRESFTTTIKDEVSIIHKMIPYLYNYGSLGSSLMSVLDVISEHVDEELKRDLFVASSVHQIRKGFHPFIERDFFYLGIMKNPSILKEFNFEKFDGWYSIMVAGIKEMNDEGNHISFLEMFSLVDNEIVIAENRDAISRVTGDESLTSCEDFIYALNERYCQSSGLILDGKTESADKAEEEPFIKYKNGEDVEEEIRKEINMENTENQKVETEETKKEEGGFFSKGWVKTCLIVLGSVAGGAAGAYVYNKVKEELDADQLLEEIVFLPDGTLDV